MPPEEIAADWYDWLYLPTLEAARSVRLADLLPATLEGEVSLAIHQRRVAMAPELGGVTYEQAAMAAEAGGPPGASPAPPSRIT